MAASEPLLRVEGLGVAVRRRGGDLPILQDVRFDLAADETLAIVGESGSGKSMLALAITRLLDPPQAYAVTGRVRFRGEELLALPPAAMRRVRGGGIAVVFQEALNALNPVLTVGRQLEETIRQRDGVDAAAARREAVRLLDEVRIPSPERRLDDYPHQLSGGMRQRVMIAIALACRPALIIADEPTTSLDVTIQSQILALLRDLRRRNGMSMIFISHNLGAVAAVADRVAVMYAGQMAELSAADALFRAPAHPYARALLATTPRVDRPSVLAAIAGQVPRFDALPPGCRFEPRCPLADADCRAAVPDIRVAGDGRQVRCIRPLA
ncbi:ABC transporter ATP-binding protein [Stella sp.]|uniref:ABC transporter ATP-binding protein n=1 Tax=Stella sp. TaxID=2912054 RepID=UPI0035B495FA